MLEIHVTKPEQRKPRRIEIGGANQKTIEGKASKARARFRLARAALGPPSLVGERLFEPRLGEELA